MSNGKRVNRIVFLLTDEELATIKEKMDQLGIVNMSAFLRKMALNGYILRLNMPEIDKLCSMMQRYNNNLNQIAKRVNATSRIYENDLNEIQNQQKTLWSGINDILIRLGKTI